MCFTVIELLFLQMESGGFGETITASVSGLTRRILLFNNIFYLCWTPFCNVVGI